jgi:DNA-binding XRE family transcriptional regulator
MLARHFLASLFHLFCSVTRFVTEVTRFVTLYGVKWRVVRHGNQKRMATNVRMKAARVLVGLTQQKLADKVGTREIEISRIETGRVTPATAMKRRIAEVLQKPTFELFEC